MYQSLCFAAVPYLCFNDVPAQTMNRLGSQIAVDQRKFRMRSGHNQDRGYLPISSNRNGQMIQSPTSNDPGVGISKVQVSDLDLMMVF